MRTAIYQPSPAQKRYLFNQTITWGDASTELVQIDPNGYFCLNGVRKKLVGFNLGSSFASGNFYDAGNVTIVRAELSTMQAAGIRVIQIDPYYTGLNQEARYDGLLTACYDYKMLVIAQCAYKFMTDGSGSAFDSLSTVDFSLGSETISQALPKWVSKIKSYSNVVAIILENEPDIWLAGQSFTIASMVAYMNLLKPLITSSTSIPVIVKLCGNQYSDLAYHMQKTMLPYSAVPCFDPYCTTANLFTAGCNQFIGFCSINSRNQQVWVGEMGTPDGTNPVATSMTKAMVDAVLAKNVSVVLLFAGNRYSTANQSYFNTATGAAVAGTLTADANFADYIATWQAPI
jgi:hypothetical protein